MPFHIIKEQRGVYKKFSGFVTNCEFLQSIFENQSDPDYDRLVYSINDFSEVTDHNVTPKDVNIAGGYALGAEFTNSQIKIAIITEDQGIQDLVSGFTAISNYPLKIFSSVQDARNWIAKSADV
jgi:hypothetical protein